MKLNPDFLSHSLDGEAVLVPTAQAEFHGLVQGNRTLAVILECLQNDVTEEDIVDALAARFRGDRALMRADVREAIEKLRGIGAVDG